MPITTTAVLFKLIAPDGQPVADVKISALLSSNQVDDGLIIRSEVSGFTDSNGIIELPLWPNTRGDGLSYYKVKHSGLHSSGLKYGEFFIKVPEATSANASDLVISEPIT